jgi:hypothetical protein
MKRRNKIAQKAKKTNNPPPSAAGFAHSGDEAPLVNEINNLDKDKNRMPHRDQNEIKRNRERIKPKRLISALNLITFSSDEWLTSPSIVPLHPFFFIITKLITSQTHSNINNPIR